MARRCAHCGTIKHADNDAPVPGMRDAAVGESLLWPDAAIVGDIDRGYRSSCGVGLLQELAHPVVGS